MRRADAMVCSSSAAERVRGLVGPTVLVIVDDRALNQRAIQMLGAILVQQDGHDGHHLTAALPRKQQKSSGIAGRPPSWRAAGEAATRNTCSRA